MDRITNYNNNNGQFCNHIIIQFKKKKREI